MSPNRKSRSRNGRPIGPRRHPAAPAPAPVPQGADDADDPLLALQRMVQTRAVLVLDGVRYVWDFANHEAVPEDEMPPGSARFEASEQARFKSFRDQFSTLVGEDAGEDDEVIVWQPDDAGDDGN